VNAILNIQPGADFTITVSPASQTVIPGGTAVYTISVAAQGSFSGAVSLSVGAITGATAYFSSSTVQPGTPVTLTVNTFATTLLGSAPIPITAIAGSITQTATLSLSVQALTVSPSSPAAPTVLANGQPFTATYNFNNGSGTWLNANTCITGDPNVTATVGNQTSSSATVTYTANIATTSRSVAAVCSYTCPGGTGPITLPPVTVSPAPVIFTVTDLEENPNPVVYAGVPTTVLIDGEYFGATAGNLGLCLSGANPCIFPSGTVACNLPPVAVCSTISFQQWSDGLIEATITLPSGASGTWDLYVISNAWIAAAAAAHPSLGGFHVSAPPPTVVLAPTDISGNPGDVFTFTATGVSPTGASGSYQWSITEDATYPGNFQFVSSSCTSGASCTQATAPACTGLSSCTAYVQGIGTGFANIGVVFQVASASSQRQPARARTITVIITKIWSNQFPGGSPPSPPIANYLPADGVSPTCGTGTQSNGATPICTGAGAGLIGNSRQLLIVGVGQSPPSFGSSNLYGYIGASLITVPATQEALNHILVGFQPGDPILVPAIGGGGGQVPQPNPMPPIGSSAICTPLSVCGSVFYAYVPPAPLDTEALDTDYSVVAGVDPGAGNTNGGTLTTQQPLFMFALQCQPAPDTANPPCSNGAVRIVSAAEHSDILSGIEIGAFFSGLPTAADFVTAFGNNTALTDVALAGLSQDNPCTLVNPCPPGAINTSELYFNDGVILGPAPAGASPSLYAASVPLYNFRSISNLTSLIQQSQDFQELINETLQLHKGDVSSYFNGQNPSSSYAFPAWQAIGCGSIPNTDCSWIPSTPTNFTGDTYFSPGAADQVDTPPLFPCATGPGALPPLPNGLNASMLECDLAFINNADLHKAFGRVGYSFTITATISRNVSTGKFFVENIALAGYIYDTYQWNPAVVGTTVPLIGALLPHSADYYMANFQAGFNTVTPGGQVFRSQIQLDTSSLLNGNFTYIFQ